MFAIGRRRLVQVLERPAGQQFAPSQRPEVVSSFVFLDTTRTAVLWRARITGLPTTLIAELNVTCPDWGADPYPAFPLGEPLVSRWQTTPLEKILGC